jgi:glycerophosphoryl diester phosphodiesterase
MARERTDRLIDSRNLNADETWREWPTARRAPACHTQASSQATEEERTPYRLSADIVQLLSQWGPTSRADLSTMSAKYEPVKRGSDTRLRSDELGSRGVATSPWTPRIGLTVGFASLIAMVLRWKRTARVGLAVAATLWVGNSSWLHGATGKPPLLLAHRGLGQTFPIGELGGAEDTSKMIDAPEHPFIENTLPSMEAAFAYGADIVELDIQRTADGRLAVFHDAVLEFRTEGQGPIRARTLQYLKSLDVGFGYSADGGKTFPFRGTGVGLMPTLDEVLDRFPDREFLIHIKSNDSDDGSALADLLAQLPPGRLQPLAAYGGDRPIQALARALPSFRVMSKSTLLKAGLTYLALGWTGYMPAACRGTELHMPLRFAPLFWGWPHRLVDRMDSVGTRVVLVSGSGRWSEGFDSQDSVQAIPQGFAGVIWTNRIDRIGPVLKPR